MVANKYFLFLLLFTFIASPSDAQFIEAALLRGSFDPPTIGHKALALEMQAHLGFSRLYITVKTLPDKDYKASSQERIHLLQTLFAQTTDFEVIVIRERYNDPLQTTLDVLKHEPKGLYMIYGEDVFKKNYRALEHLSLLEFVVGLSPGNERRGDLGREFLDNLPRTRKISLQRGQGVSSTLFRSQRLNGVTDQTLLDPSVLRQIEINNLYPYSPTADEFELQRNFRERASQFLALVAHRFPNLSLPLDLGAFTPLQTSKAEHEKLARTIIEFNKIHAPAAHILWLRLLDLPYVKQKRTIHSDASPFCRQVFTPASGF